MPRTGRATLTTYKAGRAVPVFHAHRTDHYNYKAGRLLFASFHRKLGDVLTMPLIDRKHIRLTSPS